MPDTFTITSLERLVLGIIFLGLVCIGLAEFGGWEQRNLDPKGKRFFLNIGRIMFFGGIIIFVLMVIPPISSNLKPYIEYFAFILHTIVSPTPAAIPPSTQLQANQIILTRGGLILVTTSSMLAGIILTRISTSVGSSRKSNPDERRRDDVNLSEFRPIDPKNEIYFNILNDKSSPIVVKQMYFYKRDAQWVQGESNWPHVYSRGNVDIDPKTSHTGRFILEEESQKAFSIIGYAPDKQDLNMTGFPIGVHKFDAKIVYAFKDKPDHDFYTYYIISVDYKGKFQFSLDIRHRN